MTHYHYCERWFRHKEQPIGPLDEVAARRAHEARGLYTVVVGMLQSPECFVELDNDYVGVGFLDDLRREYLRYAFQELEPDKMFLVRATHRLFDGRSDTIKSATVYYFNKDGIVTIEDHDVLAGTRTKKKIVADVSGNWERRPNFGEYAAITRVNRDNTVPVC